MVQEVTDPQRIYLQPLCCSGPEGRYWSEHKADADCDDGAEPTAYVLEAATTALEAENAALRERVAVLDAALREATCT